MSRYLNSPRKTPPPIEIAAADNLSPEFFKTLSALGLEILVVRLEAAKDSPVCEHAGIERELERELQAIRAGQFDSSYFTLGAQWHFFHVATGDLGKAMACVKDALAGRGLLDISIIYHAETFQEWRQWHPPTAEVLDTDPEADA
jgi:hypothetical protein